MAKNREIRWLEFDWITRCDMDCPLCMECKVWDDVANNNPSWDFSRYLYRIKPKLEYVDWDWDTVPKDLVKVVNKGINVPLTVLGIYSDGIVIYDCEYITVNYSDIRKYDTQLSGEPCGVLKGGGECTK